MIERIRRERSIETVKNPKPLPNTLRHAVHGILTYKSDEKDTFRAYQYRWYFIGKMSVAFVKVESGTFTLYANGQGGTPVVFGTESDLHTHIVKELEQ